jgi:type I restriction enzyme S subunit
VTGRYGTLGEVFYVESDFWPLNTALYVRDFKGHDRRFIAALLESMDLAQHDGAAAVPGLNRNQLHELPVRVPPLETQRRIADVLGAIDDLIENNQRRVELLEEMAKAIYREWFVHFRFPGHESATFVDSPLGPIPEGWEVMSSSTLVEVNPRIRVEKSHEAPLFVMADLDNRLAACFPSATRVGGSGSKFQDGDTLLARITPCLENGKSGLVQGLGPGVVARGSTEFIVLRGRVVGESFTYCLARSEEFRGHAKASMSGASGRQRVRTESLDTFLVAAPPKPLSDEFESHAWPLLKAAHNLQVEAGQLATLRDQLLPKLVTGQIVV